MIFIFYKINGSQLMRQCDVNKKKYVIKDLKCLGAYDIYVVEVE